MKIYKIAKKASNNCGGFRPPKGHLDTQMFPECEGTETDRNIVKKTEEKNKKRKKKSVEAKHSNPIAGETGIWTQWKEGLLDDQEFVQSFMKYKDYYEAFVVEDPVVHGKIDHILSMYTKDKDASMAAKRLSVALSYENIAEEEEEDMGAFASCKCGLKRN